jgi:polyisoprenoid-binding protein YceI
MLRLGPPAAQCRVLTYCEGLLSSFGHDLELAVTRFDIRIDPEARRADASFDAASLRVERAYRGGVEHRGLSDADRRRIEDNVRREVLEVTRHPEVRFRSTRVADVDGGWDVTGKLALHGKERDVQVPLRRDGDRYLASIRLRQEDFGIQPYSAFLGGLKVKSEVVIRLSLPADAASQQQPARSP